MKRVLTARLDESTIALLDAWAAYLANGHVPSRARAVEYLAAAVPSSDEQVEAAKSRHVEMLVTARRRRGS